MISIFQVTTETKVILRAPLERKLSEPGKIIVHRLLTNFVKSLKGKDARVRNSTRIVARTQHKKSTLHLQMKRVLSFTKLIHEINV